MTLFWVIVVLVLLATVGALVYPVVRTRSQSPRYVVLLITALGVPALALSVYLSIGHWQGPEPVAHAQQEEVGVIIEQLADRLQRQGGTLDEWMMLGKSYTAMGRYGDAAGAYDKARGLAGDGNLDVLAFYAEARLLADPNQLRGEAGNMFEQVLAARPDDPRGLWYGGLAAYEKSQFGLAVSRWQQLLEQAPPDNLRPILEQRIDDARMQLGAASMPQPGAELASASNEPPPAAEPSSVAPPAAAPAAGQEKSVVRISVTADPRLIGTVPPNTPVFVLARSTSPGPPLAARRMSVRDLPFTLELSDDDAMVPGRDLSSSSQVEIVARVSLGGTPVAQPGDLFGAQELDVTEKMPLVAIRIDKRVE